MQDGFIDFIDIKLQSAEQTRLKVKKRIDYLSERIFEYDDLENVTYVFEWLHDAIYDAYYFGLIDDKVTDRLLDKSKELFALRCDELRRENE